MPDTVPDKLETLGDNKIWIARGRHKTDKHPKVSEISIEEHFCEHLANHRTATIKDGPHTIYAKLSQRHRHHRFIMCYSAAVVDIDRATSEEEIRTALDGLLYAAYTTYSGCNRARVVLPYREPCGFEAHRRITRHLNTLLGGDKSAEARLRFYYDPTCQPGADHWAFNTMPGVNAMTALLDPSRYEEQLPPTDPVTPEVPQTNPPQPCVDNDDLGSLPGRLSAGKLLKPAEVEHHLNYIDPDVHRDDWLRCLAAVHLCTDGSDKGLALADDWSSRGGKYAGPHDVERVYKSLSAGDREAVAGPGTLIHLAQQNAKWKPFNQPLAEAVAEQVDEWSDPEALPQGLPDVMPFDFALLPEALRPWGEDIADRMQCPPDFVAIAAMVALSAAVRNQVVVAPKQRDPWRVPLTLWGMAIGKPGVMKTPAMAEAAKPLYRLEAEEREKYHQNCVENERLVRANQMVKAEAEKDLKKRIKDLSAEEIAEALAQIDGEEVGPPTQTRLTTDNTTPEALVELLKQNPLGLTVWRDELAGFLKMCTKEGYEELASLMLSGYDGNRAYQLDRIKRGTGHFVANVWLSFIGSVQPGVLKQYVSSAVDSDGADNGLLQRFGLMVWPDTPKDWTNVDRAPDSLAKDALYKILKRLKDREQVINLESGKVEPSVLRFAADAQAIADQFKFDLEHELRSGENHHALESHLSKYRKLMPTIAALLALADGANEWIPLAATEKAIAWCEYLKTHAIRVYRSGLHSEFDTGRLIQKRIESGDLQTPFTARDVYRRQWSGLKDAKQVQAALEVLEVHGWLHELSVRKGSGRPSAAYAAHPKLLSHQKKG